jgi:hypothetical protein
MVDKGCPHSEAFEMGGAVFSPYSYDLREKMLDNFPKYW